MTDQEPEGRTFGKGQLDSENTLEALRQKVEWVQEAGADGQRGLERRVTSVEEEVIKALERINVLRGDIDAATVRIAQLETGRLNFETVDDAQAQALIDLRERLKRLENQTLFETSEDDARIRHLEKVERFREMYSSPTGRTGPPSTLDEAERRVREYMKGSFSEATIGGVVAAIRGVVMTPGSDEGFRGVNPPGRFRPIKDNPQA